MPGSLEGREPLSLWFIHWVPIQASFSRGFWRSGNHSWPPSPIPWLPLHLPNQPVIAQALGSDHKDYYGQCQWRRPWGCSSQSISLLYVTFTFGGLRQNEGVSLETFLPNSLLCMRCLIAPDNGQAWTERSPDPKVPWRHESSYSLHCPPLALPHFHITGLWALSLLFYVAIFQIALSYPHLLSRAAMYNLVL